MSAIQNSVVATRAYEKPIIEERQACQRRERIPKTADYEGSRSIDSTSVAALGPTAAVVPLFFFQF